MYAREVDWAGEGGEGWASLVQLHQNKQTAQDHGFVDGSCGVEEPAGWMVILAEWCLDADWMWGTISWHAYRRMSDAFTIIGGGVRL